MDEKPQLLFGGFFQKIMSLILNFHEKTFFHSLVKVALIMLALVRLMFSDIRPPHKDQVLWYI